MYTGSGGVVFVYLNLFKLYKDSVKSEIFKARFLEAFNVNLHLIESGKCKRALSCPSFFHSVSGLYTVGALFFEEVKDEEKRDEMVGKLVGDFYNTLIKNP
jgi:hypothetical protein